MVVVGVMPGRAKKCLHRVKRRDVVGSMFIVSATRLFRLGAAHRTGGHVAGRLNNRNGNTNRLHGRAIA